MGHSPVTTAVYAAASDEVADRIAAAVVRQAAAAITAARMALSGTPHTPPSSRAWPNSSEQFLHCQRIHATMRVNMSNPGLAPLGWDDLGHVGHMQVQLLT